MSIIASIRPLFIRSPCMAVAATMIRHRRAAGEKWILARETIP